jgi:hypothetical protein
MRRLSLASSLACFSALWVAGLVHAQGYAPNYQFSPYARPNYVGSPRPVLSPYLNLLRGGNPAANYFLGVLPEFERRANAYQFSTLVVTVTTGHPTAFGNTAGYFGSGPGQRPTQTPAAAPGGGRRSR